MTDPLSISASVAGLTSLGIQVAQSLIGFYQAYKDRDSDLAGTIRRLESLEGTIQYLESALAGRVFQADERPLVQNIERSVEECDGLIEELRLECEKFTKASTTGKLAALKVAGRQVTYPFRQSTLQKLDEDISAIRENISIALNALEINSTQRIDTGITDVKALLELVKVNQISSDLRDWLSAPDAAIDHNNACIKKHPGTGMWLVKSTEFSSGLTEANSVLWVRGFAGSGKSVLCSTAIQSVLRHRGQDCRVAIAFFYFTFNDNSKQDASSMIRSLLLQLSTQLQDNHTDLMNLYQSYKLGLPPPVILLEYLRRLIQRFNQVYMLLDALDESPRTGPREFVLNALETVRSWNIAHLHLFVTSREELDIEESLGLSINQQINMKNKGIDEDIANFIEGQLHEDRRLRKLSTFHEKI